MGIPDEGPIGSFISDVVATVHGEMARQHRVPIEPVADAGPPWTEGELVLPRAGDPARFEFDERIVDSMLLSVPYFETLAAVVVPVARAVAAGQGKVHDRRVDLYRLILRAGEPVPPILVERAGEQWRVLDGSNRVEAARLEGVANLVGLCVGSAPVVRPAWPGEEGS